MVSSNMVVWRRLEQRYFRNWFEHILVENKTHENRNQTIIESANQNGRTQDKSEHKMDSPRWTHQEDRSKQLHKRKKSLY